MKTTSTWLVFWAAMLVLWQSMAFATDELKLSIANWAFDNVNAQNLAVNLQLTQQGLKVNASADSIELAPPIGILNKVTLKCTELVLLSGQTNCAAGKLGFIHKEYGTQNIAFSIKAMPEQTHYQVSVSNLKFAGATFVAQLDYDDKHWQASIQTPKAALSKLVHNISPYLDDSQKSQLSNWTYDSDIAVQANLTGHQQQLEQLKLDLTTSALNLSDKEGKYVTENLVMNMLLDLALKNKTWQWQTDINLKSGQAYAQPVFVDFDDAALSLQATGEWQNEQQYLVIKDAYLNHQNIMQAHGSYSGTLQKIDALDVTIQQANLATLYPVWLQPFALGSAADKLELAGQLGLEFKQQAGNYQLSVNLNKVYVDDQNSRFALYGLDGDLAWSNNETVTESKLSWQGGSIYAVPFGESTLHIAAHSSSLSLLEPWSLPILDGALLVNDFTLNNALDDKIEWTFDGLVTPISMESLSAALDWPSLHGKLSGVIPKVSYANEQVQVDGALMVKLFDGTTVIRDLRLDKPFGTLPQLYANVDLTGLDLEILTQTFDFGKITGKLDGRLTGLRLSNWQPVQFDAHFATPENDKNRRRISQRAIDNLSQIGGGVGGILSRSFLRFFEDFSYQKLGLNCKLLNEVCVMSGIDEAKQGYYIVKGGGLPPRINVVGYTRQVDWPDLIERLKAVSQSSGPVIQ
ncbi:MAG TPA: hypothetical protein ENI24_12385 [Methylophaga sp.]|nr:hypothetical protein [Methylophaga sp.]